MFEVEQDDGGLGDRADPGRAEADHLECGEDLFEQGVGALAYAVHARMTLLYVVWSSVSSPPFGFLQGWRMAGDRFW